MEKLLSVQVPNEIHNDIASVRKLWMSEAGGPISRAATVRRLLAGALRGVLAGDIESAGAAEEPGRT